MKMNLLNKVIIKEQPSSNKALQLFIAVFNALKRFRVSTICFDH